MLFETTRGRRRLFRNGDYFHPDRKDGKIRPDKTEIPAEYKSLVDWYDTVYSKQPSVVSEAAMGNTEAQKAGSRPVVAPGAAFTTVFVGAAGAFVIPDQLQQELGLSEGARLCIRREGDRLVLEPITENFIRQLRGCCRGEDSLVEAWDREHRTEK